MLISGLKHLLDSEATLSTGLSLALPVYAAQGLARSLRVARGEAREIIANLSVTLKFGVGEVVKEKNVRPLSPRKAEREVDVTSPPGKSSEAEGSSTIRPQTVTLQSTPAPLQVSKPVLALLKADPTPSLPHNCTLVHRTYGGEEVRGKKISCSEVLLVPGQAAVIANKQLLSRLLANFLVVEVWQDQQLVGLGKIPTAPLHKELTNGEPDQVVEALQGLIQVTGVTDGEVVGQLAVGLWVGTQKQLDSLDKEEKLEEKKKTEQVDRETMTEVAKNQGDSIMFNESATEEGLTHEYDTPASESDVLEVSKEEDTVLEVPPPQYEKWAEGSEANFVEHLPLRLSLIEGRNLPPTAALYCTMLGVTSSVARDNDVGTKWDFNADIRVDLEYLTDSRKRLIMKVWSLRGISPNVDQDQMVGFAAIDISPLQALPRLYGWYNVLDWVGKCRGQVSLKMEPLKPVPRFEHNRRISVDPGPVKYMVQGTYSTFPCHMVSHTRQIISPMMNGAPSKTSAPAYEAHTDVDAVHPQFNFLPADPTRSFLEGRLASNLADLDNLSKNLAASLRTGGTAVDQAELVELEEPSLNDTTFLIAGRQEEELTTGRSIASLSMMQNTIDENLACIRGLAEDWPREQLVAGEGSSLADQRVQEPVPTSMPDLNLVLQDLGLDLDTLQLQPQVRITPPGIYRVIFLTGPPLNLLSVGW